MILITLKENTTDSVSLGRKGEDEVRALVYDLSYFIEKLGDGTFEFIYHPINSAESYNLSQTFRIDNKACAVITKKETRISGPGELQLVFYPNNSESETPDNAKSQIFSTNIERSL